MRSKFQRRMRGVTLIELLTVVAVLAILSTVAVSAYRSHVVRVNRTDATATLLRVQVAQEKYFLQNNVYADELPTKLGFASDTTPQGRYKVTLAAAGESGFATSYVATATAFGTQSSSDPQCQTLTIDDKGQRGSSPGNSSICWR
jgi:type IV pilus assembly protein PilE